MKLLINATAIDAIFLVLEGLQCFNQPVMFQRAEYPTNNCQLPFVCQCVQLAQFNQRHVIDDRQGEYSLNRQNHSGT